MRHRPMLPDRPCGRLRAVRVLRRRSRRRHSASDAATSSVTDRGASFADALGIDHLVIAVADPDAASAELEAKLGLAPGGGGRHDRLGTFNRLVSLGDTYLELIGVFDRAAAASSWIGADAVRQPATTPTSTAYAPRWSSGMSSDRDAERPRHGLDRGPRRGRRASRNRRRVPPPARHVVVEPGGTTIPIVGSELQASVAAATDPEAPDLLGPVGSASRGGTARARSCAPPRRASAVARRRQDRRSRIGLGGSFTPVWSSALAIIAAHCRGHEAQRPRMPPEYGPPGATEQADRRRSRSGATAATREQQRPPVPSHPEDAEARLGDRRVERRLDAHRQDPPRVERVDDAVVPQPRRREVGRALALVGLEDRRLEGVALGVRRRSRRGPSTGRAPPAGRP